MPELVALLEGKEVGRVRRDAQGRLSFLYSEEWRRGENAYPLSLSMPLGAQQHGRAVTEAYLWGLLPDNERVLSRWAQKFQVSARNAFALLSHVGEDCAGAVQFVVPERLEALRAGTEDNVEWLNEAEIAKRPLSNTDAPSQRLISGDFCPTMNAYFRAGRKSSRSQPRKLLFLLLPPFSNAHPRPQTCLLSQVWNDRCA